MQPLPPNETSVSFFLLKTQQFSLTELYKTVCISLNLMQNFKCRRSKAHCYVSLFRLKVPSRTQTSLHHLKREIRLNITQNFRFYLTANTHRTLIFEYLSFIDVQTDGNIIYFYSLQNLYGANAHLHIMELQVLRARGIQKWSEGHSLRVFHRDADINRLVTVVNNSNFGIIHIRKTKACLLTTPIF